VTIIGNSPISEQFVAIQFIHGIVGITSIVKLLTTKLHVSQCFMVTKNTVNGMWAQWKHTQHCHIYGCTAARYSGNTLGKTIFIQSDPKDYSSQYLRSSANEL